MNYKFIVFDFDGVLAHYDHGTNEYWPDPEAGEILKHLSKRGATLFISSATPTETLNHYLDRWQWKHFFQEIYGYPISKPNAFRSILLDHPISKNELLMIGDSLSDYTAAISVGIQFVGRINRTGPKASPFPKQISLIYSLSEAVNSSMA